MKKNVGKKKLKGNTDEKKLLNKSQNTGKKPVNVKSKKPVSNSKKQVRVRPKPVNRDKNGRILPGSGSNGGGRPIGATSTAKVEELRASITRVELEKVDIGNGKLQQREIWLDHQIRKSYEDTSLAIAILSRLYPALKAVEQISFPGDAMEAEDIEEIRKEMQKRFESRSKTISKEKEKLQ